MAQALGSRRRSTLLAALTLLPAVLIVAVWVVWIDLDGGYFPGDWYPVGIGVVALLALAALAEWQLPASRLARTSLGLLAAFVALNFLSILWAGAPGNALEASDKLLLYLVTALVLALVPWTAARAGWLIAAWSIGTLALVVLTLVDAAGAEDATAWFIEGRYAEPLGYAGGSSALAAIAAWPALLLSTSRELPAAVRAVLLSTAVVLAELAILPQSRGAVLALVLTIPVAVALAPRRGVLLLSMAVAGGTLALTLGGVLDVYSASREGRPVEPTLDSALESLALAAVLAAVGGLVVALVERRVSVPDRVIRPGRRALLGLTGLAALAGLVLLLANAGSISDSISDRWDRFRSGEDESAHEQSRFISTDDPQRYDYWRVAVEAGLDRPLAGYGAGNYEPQYTERRRDDKHSRYAHDIWARTFAETGFPGLLLLVAALACGFVALGLGARRAPPGARLVAAACAMGTGYFLIHASLDWVDEFPAVAAPGFGLLFIGLGTVYPGQRGSAPVSSPTGWKRLAGIASGLILVIGAVTALALPYLSLRYTQRAVDRYGVDAAEARHDLERAHDLNPLSIRPELAAGALAVRAGRYGEASSAYRQALSTEDNWYAHFQLALLASSEGHRASAEEEMRRARALNRADPYLSEVAARLRRGRRLDPARVNGAIQRETRERFYSLR